MGGLSAKVSLIRTQGVSTVPKTLLGTRIRVRIINQESSLSALRAKVIILASGRTRITRGVIRGLLVLARFRFLRRKSRPIETPKVSIRLIQPRVTLQFHKWAGTSSQTSEQSSFLESLESLSLSARKLSSSSPPRGNMSEEGAILNRNWGWPKGWLLSKNGKSPEKKV